MDLDRVLAVTGATYRQLDHWSRRGWLRPDGGGRGSGRPREWSRTEVEVATTMVRLVAAGITPEAAHRAARGDGVLAPGVRVLVEAAP